MAIFAKPILVFGRSLKDLLCELSKKYNINISLLSKGNAIDACTPNRNSAAIVLSSNFLQIS